MLMGISKMIKAYVNKNTKAAPLAVFRIFFGAMMVVSVIRFVAYGWIGKLYLEPSFHFTYAGFDWVTVPGSCVYVIFTLCGLAALGIMLGFCYRLSTILFFSTFTYIELMDKTLYLNHYYFVSVVAFMLIFLPAHRYFSLDAWRRPALRDATVPRWAIDSLLLMISLVYLYAGLAKLNGDWLLRALPLAIWLPSKANLPIIGSLLEQRWVHFAFSWGGAIYDLFIVFFLLYRPTRLYAYGAVLFFHLITWWFFPIGMFPFIMIGATLLFFDSSFHEKILGYLSKMMGIEKSNFDRESGESIPTWPSLVLVAVLVVQLLFPLRSHLYSGSVFWHEQGYRFAWRVMLMEKTGYAQFKITNEETGRWFLVQNQDFLTPLQEKQMSTQVDFIVQYGQYLGEHFSRQGHENVGVYVESFASLNGRKSQTFVRPDINLMTLDNPWTYYEIIEPLND